MTRRSTIRRVPKVVPLAVLATLSAFLQPAFAANIFLESSIDEDVDDNDCTLREAIVAANTNADYHGCPAGTGTSDRIFFEFNPLTTITLTGDLPTITESVALIGDGVDDLTIDGGDAYRMVVLDNATDSGPWLYVAGLTLTNGLSKLTDGGALFVNGHLVLQDAEVSSSSSGLNGGGIVVSGDALVERSRIVDNESSWVTGGGGILVQSGALTIVDSLISNNQATGGPGGGVHLFEGKSLTLRSSTISTNGSKDGGAGILAFRTSAGDTTQVTIESSTITNNDCGAGSTLTACGGGARFGSLLNGALTVSMTNTVVAGNHDTNGGPSAPDLQMDTDDGFLFTSGGFNFVGDDTGATAHLTAGNPNGDGDFVGDSSVPLDPYLGGLSDHGGPTLTHSFVVPPAMATHPLADKGSCPGALADQRGFAGAPGGPRIFDLAMQTNNPDGDACDIGALEAGATASTPSAIFADGFESGRFLFWSVDVP